MESKKFLSAEEVASEFGLDADLLKKFVDSGEVRALADRGTWKYRRDELEELASSGKIPAPPTDFDMEVQSIKPGSSGEILEFIELDEEALAEQAIADAREASDPEVDWFVPSSEPEMAVQKVEELPEIPDPASSMVQSSPDIAVYTGAEGTPRSEVVTMATSELPTIDEPTSSLGESSADVAIYTGAEGTPRSEVVSSEIPAIEESTSSLVQASADVAIYTGAEGTPRSELSQASVASIPETSASEVMLTPELSAADHFDDSTSANPPPSSDGQLSPEIAIYSGPEGTPESDHPKTSPVALSAVSPSEISLDAPSEIDDGSGFMPEFSQTGASEVQISHDDDPFEGVRPEDSGIVLDFNVGSGATVSSSGSSTRLPQSFPESAAAFTSESPEAFEGPMQTGDAAPTPESQQFPEIPSSAPSQIQMPPEVAIYTGAEGTPFSEVMQGASGITSGISDSEVTMRPGWNAAERMAEVDAVFFGHNDSEVSISHDEVDYDYDSLKPEDSGLVLDFNIDPGATVSSSGSSLRLPQTAQDHGGEISLDDEPPEAPTRPGSHTVLPNAGSSALLIDDSNDPDMVDLSGSDVDLRPDGSGLILDDASHGGLPGESSIMDELAASSSQSTPEDSGISLTPSSASGDSNAMQGAKSSSYDLEDSGISLDSSMTGDSGFTLESKSSSIDEDLPPIDSEIELSGEDSGITLSGLEGAMGRRPGSSFADFEDSEIVLDEEQGTLPDGSLFASDIELHSDATRELENESSFDLASGDATQELVIDEDEETTDFSPTVVKKGRGGGRPGLSGAFELEDPATVEDLEIADALDAGVDEEVEEFVDDDAVDASDEVFSGDEVEATDESEDDYLEPATSAKKKPTMPREPAWGMDMVVGLVACSLFLTANVLVMWSGVSTMWTGAEPLAPAAPLIDSLAGLLGR